MTRLQQAAQRSIKLALTLAITGAALAAQARTGPDVDVNVVIGGVIQPGVYGRAPPGHSKHWSRHCRVYNACNQPVYFVRNDYRTDNERGRGEGHGHGRGHERH